MPSKEFLEDYPLFRKLEVKLPKTLDGFPKPSINMHCMGCGSMQTFRMNNNYYDDFQYMNTDANDVRIRSIYLCQSCNRFTRQFDIHISPNLDYFYKFGQYPEWGIKMDKNLEKILGKHASYFRKGLVCESQGYGIAAFSYFRKITEEIIDELLDSISDLIDSNLKAKYQVALDATKKTRITQEKINLVKDLLPTILRPDGLNPLGVLHSELSEGLHANSDEDCLKIANHVKGILIFLVNQILMSKRLQNPLQQVCDFYLKRKAIKARIAFNHI